jgi:hypothetical protein
LFGDNIAKRRNMHTRIFAAGFLAILLLAGRGAAQKAETTRFSGKWQAKVNNTVVCTIELRGEDVISGSITDCRLHSDADGNLVESEPSASASPSPISNAQITGDVITFEHKDDEEIMKFEMKLVKEGVGELVIKGAPINTKPITFIRASSTK